MGIVETTLLTNIVLPWSFLRPLPEKKVNDEEEDEEIILTELYY